MVEPVPAPRPASSRIRAIDVARGIALVAMAIYHFTWDLEFFGYVEPGLTAFGGWKIFARCIASSFLFLVGVSLVLAHARGVRWRPFLIRLGQVALAAAAISLVTWFAVPGGFIFFGILHQIALASLLGVLFLRFPAWMLAGIAALMIAGPFFLRSALFDTPWLWWVGLSTVNPHSNDYVPLFPWFGAVLLGMAAAKTAQHFGIFDRMRSWTPARPLRVLEAGGRHSLAFYLIHQPLLISLVWLAAQIAPPPAPDPRVGFSQACERQCVEVRDQAFCTRYCGCVMEGVETMPGGIAGLDRNAGDATQQTRLQEIAATCTGNTDLLEFDQPDD
ncbi:DUF1624 domain-containing protein [Tianweitania sp. BSSL-BM11]|uniref:DUF1624 domain-containing protein n=1 Tax=Tianweitania aestuarii TaxID=2814886 RepID=A0ABS5RU41_9HYPH|nr:heparan-alpha-glucosaminide N-acetyltransferase [Tianweitania aestuarii]MBS9720565.1 DUF1624 domain-containing protein [Tianweitania aestuarii]